MGMGTSHSSHSMRKSTGGVQHGRVSDLTKKRMGDVAAWASKSQKMLVWVMAMYAHACTSSSVGETSA